MVAVTLAGWPPRRLGGERLGHDVPVQHGARWERGPDGRKPRLTRQQEAHGKLPLAGLGKLGPVAEDRRIEIERASFDEAERADGGDGFPDGVEIDDRVGVPRPRSRGVRVAGPQVGDCALVHADGERRADLGACREDLGECPAERFEGWLAVSVNGRQSCAHH